VINGHDVLRERVEIKIVGVLHDAAGAIPAKMRPGGNNERDLGELERLDHLVCGFNSVLGPVRFDVIDVFLQRLALNVVDDRMLGNICIPVCHIALVAFAHGVAMGAIRNVERLLVPQLLGNVEGLHPGLDALSLFFAV
jgi:hypothetical protein